MNTVVDSRRGKISGWLYFKRWRLLLVGPHYETCLMSPLLDLELWSGSYIFGKFVDPWSTDSEQPLQAYFN